jgi:TPR repeat protein
MNARIPTRLLVALVAAAALTGGLSAQGQQPKPHYYDGVELVCIGIDNYDSAKVGKLNQAVADAKRFADALSTGYGISNKTMLLDKDATKKAILKALDDLDGRKQPPEAVIVYFAGHGTSFEFTKKDSPVPARVGYLIPRDADVDLSDTSRPDEWETEAIGMRFLVERIEKMKSRHVILVADACCSGFLTKRGALSETPEVVALLTDPSRSVLAATTQRQLASEGVFTTELVKQLGEGVKNEDALSVTDLFRKVRGEVVKSSEGKMTPQMSHVGSGDGEFIFIPSAIKAEEVAKVKEAVKEAVEEAKKGKDGKPLDTAKLGAVRGVLERRQKLAGRATTLSDVCKAMDAPDYKYAVNAEAEKAKWEGSFRRFEENAAFGDVLAMAGLHFCYAKGLGTEKSPGKAYRWASQAAQVDKPAGVGAFLLANCYEQNLGVGTKNVLQAERLYAKSAEGGFVLGKLAVAAQRVSTGKLTGDEAKTVKKWLDDGVAADVPSAFLLAGSAARSGKVEGIEKDLEAAVKHYKKASESGSAAASFQLYEAHSGGWKERKEKDLKVAGEELEKAAEGGIAEAQLALAKEYFQYEEFSGRLKLKADPKKGVEFAQLAGEQGNLEAYRVLAVAYVMGRGVKLDVAKAQEYFQLSMDQGRRLDVEWATRFIDLKTKALLDR